MANNIRYVKPSLFNRLPMYKFINDLTRGYEGIVGNKETYLPKTKSENQDRYEARHALSLFKDFYNPTIDGITGLVFKNGIKLNDDVPQQLQDDLENADYTGNDYQKVFSEYFENALRKGIDFILVDMPRADVQSRADEIAMGVRPYLVPVKVENITAWKTTAINGKTVLSMVKIREFAEIDDPENPFATKTEKRYRVLSIGQWELYNDDGILLDSGLTGLDFIPLFDLNLDNIGFFEAEPPLYELGKLNIDVYQIDSDSRWAAHTASVPFYFGAGIDEESAEKMIISPNSFFTTNNPDAKLTIVDYDGKGVTVNKTIVDDIIKRINEIGFSVVLEDKVQTATESTLSGQQKQSKLNKWVGLLVNSINQILNAMSIMGGYGNNGGTVTINSDILSKPLDAQTLTALNNAVSSGNLSQQSMWTMIKNGEVNFPDDWSEETEKQNINTDGMLNNPTV